MLIRFVVKNFCSFRDETVFSMAAGSFRRHLSHIVDVKGHPVLKGAFLFGANAGGKSNFVKALAFARYLAIHGFAKVNIDKKYFRLSPSGHEDEGLFQFDIFVKGGLLYSYTMSISYSKACFLGEALTVNRDGETPQCIFAYEVDGDGRAQFESEYKLDDEDSRRFEVYRADAEAAQIRKISFLSEIAKRALKQRTSSFFNHFRNVCRWLSNLLVLFPESRYNGLNYLESLDDRSRLGDLLHSFDTGIDTLLTEDADIDKLFNDMPADRRDELKARIMDDLTGEHPQRSVGLDVGDKSYLVMFDGRQLLAKKIVSSHGAPDELFEREDESDGTQRLFDLLPLRERFAMDRVVVIDELDRSLHTKATVEFIKMFYRVSNGHDSQLIATTHDHNILDLDLLRQDEIWFVERNEEHCSKLFPLSKFRARFDKDIRKDYLLGRYGALPIFTEIPDDDVEGE